MSTGMQILEEIVSDMPEPTSVADIIQEKAQKEIINNEQPQPQITKNQDGTEKKKRGRKSNAEKAAANQSRLGGVLGAAERDLAASTAERLAAATLITKCMEMSGTAIAGEKGRMHQLESENLTLCWEKYLNKMGINDIPPGIAVALFSIQYYSRVLVTPEAQPFTEKLALKVRSIFMRVKNARFNSRNDSQRENNSGEKTSENVQGKRN